MIMDWGESFAAGVEHCGGKGWHLGRLQRYGFPVPRGFVIGSAMYNEMLRAAGVAAMIDRLPDMDPAGDAAANTLEQIRNRITRLSLPPHRVEALDAALIRRDLHDTPVAVRSSATQEDSASASFAGVHDSFLNVCGREAISQAILHSYASLWTPRAVSYRRKMGIGDDVVATAIVIMKLVDAKAAGIAFSCDPATGRTDITVINANFGLGESVVRGVVEPDSYHLRAHRTVLLSKHVGAKDKTTLPKADGGTRLHTETNAHGKTVLDDATVLRLARLTQRVFYALGNGDQHQDIEWAYDGSDFWLLQARPVTALPRWTCEPLREQPDIWSNGNFRDAAPMVLPMLNVSFVQFHIDRILYAPFRVLGYSMPEGLRFVRLYQGRTYCNAALMQWLWYDAVDFPPAATNRSMGGHQGEISLDGAAHGRVRTRFIRSLRALKLLRLIRRYKKRAAQRFSQEADFVQSILNADLTALSDEALAALYATIDDRLDAYAPTFIMLTSASGALNMLRDTLEKYFSGEADTMANALLSGQNDLTSANQGYHLLELAECVDHDPAAQAYFNRQPFDATGWQALPDDSPFKQRFKTLLAEQGHRAVYEIDLRNPRWHEDPAYLLSIIKQNIGRHALADIRQTQRKTTQEAWAKVRARVPRVLHGLIKHFAKQAAEGAACKEIAKSVYIRLMWPLRIWALEAGRRLHQRGLIKQPDDIFHCADVDIVSILKGEWHGEGLAALIDARQTRHAQLEQQTPPDVILGEQPQYSKAPPTSGGSTLHGMGVAAGCATGTARRVHTPDQGMGLAAGDVLVAPSTDPAWTPLFLNAAAIVMETGGQLSHGAIVAREYGIPAVVNVPGVFECIQEHDRLVVDGNRGVVEIDR